MDIATASQVAKSLGLDKVVNFFLKNLKGEEKLKGVEFSVRSRSELETNLESHAQDTVSWAEYLEYRHDGNPMALIENYIDLCIWDQPHQSGGKAETRKTLSIWEIITTSSDHIVLLGRPGTGKTTTLKAIVQDLMKGGGRISIGDKPVFEPIPIVFRLREKPVGQSIVELLLLAMQIETRTPQGFFDRPHAHTNLRLAQLELVSCVLNKSKLLVLLDGFDELNLQDKEDFAKDFGALTRRVTNSTIILTSRTADFYFSVNNAKFYEVSPMTSDQAKKLIRIFFASSPDEAEGAIGAIIDKKLIGADAVPLNLTQLCAIYKKYGKLYNSRRQVYAKIIGLIIDDWDAVRLVRRGSLFEYFDSEDKLKLLRKLAFELSKSCAGSSFDDDVVQQCFGEIIKGFKGIRSEQFREAMREIEADTGFFLYAGHGYEFRHKTLQEYLFAIHLLDFPDIPNDKKLLIEHPYELALAVSINDNPSLYLSYLVLNRFDHDFYQSSFIAPFLDRLILEGTKLEPHPYLGLSAILICNGINAYRIKKKRIKENFYSIPSDHLDHFYDWISEELNIKESILMLKDFYRPIGPARDSRELRLKITSTISSSLSYNEPNEITCPFEYIGYFSQ